ncbi:MAG TPA: hypothetical protein VFD64_17510 [Gemmatimonadaceae bacterium]|nr:hypothetical protein [Gemmatimonadaceae bacterium]
MPTSHHHDDSLGLDNGHREVDSDEVTTTPSGREKAQSGNDPFTSRLPDEFFDELREKRGFGRKLSRLRGIGLANPDPIVEVALRKISAEFGTRSAEIEDALASQYLSDVEAVTSRLNARQLPRLTRLLLTQRGVYVNFLAAAIEKVEERSEGGGRAHTHEPRREDAPRERGRKSKVKTARDRDPRWKRRTNARSAD